MLAVALIISTVISARLEHIAELLHEHNLAILEGPVDEDSPFSMTHIEEDTRNIQFTVIAVLVGAFAVQYVTLFAIVRRGLAARIKIENNLRYSYAQLESISKVDSLTGLFNRRATHDYVEVEISRMERDGGSIGFILLDLDGLKSINDTHGHEVGDQALKLLASTINMTKRAPDWAGRWGGDEFVWVLPSSGITETVTVAERFRESLNSSIVKLPNKGSLHIHVSQGISYVSSERVTGSSFDDLFSQADQALYQAKRKGINQIAHFTDTEQKA